MKNSQAMPAGRGRRLLLYGVSAVAMVLVGLQLTSRVGMLASRRLPVAAAVGALAPDFTLGKAGEPGELKLSVFRGKPTVLNFFCGCGECRSVAMQLAERTKELGDVHVLAVMSDHTAYNPINLKNFRWGTGFQWPVVADIGSNVSLRYDSVNCPRVWILDADGVVRHICPGRGTPGETIVADALKALQVIRG
jgi:peroxiredoxin